MSFTSYDYLIFLAALFVIYWILRVKSLQNLILLTGSYVFYGYIQPWFCILILFSTIIDYVLGLAMSHFIGKRKILFVISLGFNLCILGFFKYFNFFSDNLIALISSLGIKVHSMTFQIIIPIGISFYTLQKLTYIIELYRGNIQVRKNFIDFALFVSFFPQLLSGPIERASRLLPQIEQSRRWNWEMFSSAWPLIVRGYLKKMVIADNVSVYVDKIFMLDHPTFMLITAGTLAFTLQIYADFSAYTDIARGSARMLGFNLMENFNSPYLAVSPSDFWRRWHISFSSWIRDYLYIPLGGSRVDAKWKYMAILIISLGLSGLWHGAAWNFVIWGIYYAVLIFLYRWLGFSGRWKPKGKAGNLLAWSLMFCFTLIGWAIFRASSIEWLTGIFSKNFSIGISGDSLIVSYIVLTAVALYSLPLFALMFLDRIIPKRKVAHSLFYGLAVIMIIVLVPGAQQDFIYSQF